MNRSPNFLHQPSPISIRSPRSFRASRVASTRFRSPNRSADQRLLLSIPFVLPIVQCSETAPQTQDYVEKLFSAFESVKDLQDTPSLENCFRIFKALVMNDIICDKLLEEKKILRLLDVLERLIPSLISPFFLSPFSPSTTMQMIPKFLLI